MEKKSPIPVCIIGLRDGNKLLLVKRKRQPYSGYWCLIGGTFYLGERIEDVVKREVKEETGYTPKDDIKINGMYNEILLNKNDEPSDHFVFIAVQANLDKRFERNEIVEDTDVETFKWFDLPLKEPITEQIIPTDLIMINNFNSDALTFKQFILKDNGEKLKLVDVIE